MLRKPNNFWIWSYSFFLEGCTHSEAQTSVSFSAMSFKIRITTRNGSPMQHTLFIKHCLAFCGYFQFSMTCHVIDILYHLRNRIKETLQLSIQHLELQFSFKNIIYKNIFTLSIYNNCKKNTNDQKDYSIKIF